MSGKRSWAEERCPLPRGGGEGGGCYFFFSKCKQIICWRRSLKWKEESTYKTCVKRQILSCEIEEGEMTGSVSW